LPPLLGERVTKNGCMESTQFQVEETASQDPKNIILIIFIILLGIIVIGGSVFAFVKRSKQKKGEQASVSTVGEMQMVTGTEEIEIPVIEEIDLFPNDKDRDGIEDAEEAVLGTSDFDFDTDGDGLSDKSEIDTWKTDPVNPDTDGDGYNDGFEVLSGYNPVGEGMLDRS
jgi:hypothetical protein